MKHGAALHWPQKASIKFSLTKPVSNMPNAGYQMLDTCRFALEDQFNVAEMQFFRVIRCVLAKGFGYCCGPRVAEKPLGQVG